MKEVQKMRSSELPGFHKLSVKERLGILGELCDLSEMELDILSGKQGPSLSVAENLIENVVGFFPVPLGIASYFKIDGRDILIPMAVEETSIVAAASATAKWIRREGFISTQIHGNTIIGQIQLPNVRNVTYARNILEQQKNELIALSNQCVPGLVKRGGGVVDVRFRELERASGDGTMLVVHIHCNSVDAMGANLINQICEAMKPFIERWTDERVGLCILSNLVDSKLVSAEVVLENVDPIMAKGIEEASLFAETDPYRATTHNKGVLNGIDAVLLATGNDWRAVEAGVHAYCSRGGAYRPISTWRASGTTLRGKLEAPLSVGTVGGVTRVHPTARIALKILGVNRAEDLARICAAVGLVQNLGALRALSTVGIVKGHMQLHAANLALAAGAELHEMAEVKQQLLKVLAREKIIHLTQAQQILNGIRTRASIH